MKIIVNKLLNSWYQKPQWWTIILWLFAKLFMFIVFLRQKLYQYGFKNSLKIKVPVIIVGNISVGGTGKTPLVIYLATLLKENGYRPGIISRGYVGEVHKFPYEVTEQSGAKSVGDEAVVIQQRTQCPMFIGQKRAEVAQTLLVEHDCDVIISDDGLQHYALARDIEIAVVDAERRFGNGLCLPAGPLREPISRLKTVDFIVINGQANQGECSMQLCADKFRNIVNSEKTYALDAWVGKTIHAVAGIGYPERFFAMLRKIGLDVLTHVFPDHYCYTADDVNFMDALPVIMTEKDAVKCKDFNNDKLWYVPVSAKLPDDFSQGLLQYLKKIEL